MSIKEIELLKSVLKNYEIGNITGDDAIGRISVFAPMFITHIKDLEMESDRKDENYRLLIFHKDELDAENKRLRKAMGDCGISKCRFVLADVEGLIDA